MTNKEQTAVIARLKEQARYDEWRAQHEERMASGLNVRAWCRERGISPSTYYNHLRRMRERFCEEYASPVEAVTERQTAETQSVVPLRSIDRAEGEITIVSGEIQVHTVGDISSEKLRAIIGALRSC